MSSNSENFRQVLTDAEIIIKSKIELLQQGEEAAKEEIDPVIVFCQEIARPFYHEKLQLIDFEFDEVRIRKKLIVFSTGSINNADELKSQVLELAQEFNDAGLEKAIKEAKALIDSVINERILSEEAATRRMITITRNKLFPQNRPLVQLQQDPWFVKFINCENHHLPIRDHYRSALKEGLIQGLEGDMLNIKRFGILFGRLTKKLDLVETYEHYTDFISQRVKVLEEKPA